MNSFNQEADECPAYQLRIAFHRILRVEKDSLWLSTLFPWSICRVLEGRPREVSLDYLAER